VGGSTTEEGGGSDNRCPPFDSASIISERKTYLGRGSHLREWGVSHPVRGDVPGLRGCSPGSGGGRDANWTASDLETPQEMVCQCWALRRLSAQCVLASSDDSPYREGSTRRRRCVTDG
jgi:hypothetical protein